MLRSVLISPLLRSAAVAACFGAGLIAVLGDWPLRTLLWDAGLMEPVVGLFGVEWTAWATSETVDRNIDLAGKISGWLLVVLGLLIASPLAKGWLRPTLSWIAFCILLLRHFLIWKEHFWQVGQLLELCLLTGAPLLWGLWGDKFGAKKVGPSPDRFAVVVGTLRSNAVATARTEAFATEGKEALGVADTLAEAGGGGRFFGSRRGIGFFLLRLLIALTFIGHGLYAAGIHAVPANFVLMTQASLGLSESLARQLLLGVGWLDFIAAFLLLLPWRRCWLLALVWIVPWAMLTTLARLWSYGGLVSAATLLTQWLPETIVRLPHVLIPLALLFWARSQEAK